jgi:poly(3-hydroxybutyrate) depolymerase
MWPACGWAAVALGCFALGGCGRDEAKPSRASTQEEMHAATSAAQAAAKRRALAGAHREGLLERNAKDWPKPGRYERTLEIEKVPRRYLVQLPGGFNPWHKVPILVALHAAGSTAAELARNDAPLTRAAAAEQYVAVFPEGGITHDGGGGKEWADQGCQPSKEAGGDLRFLRAVLAEIGREPGVDAKRVFVLGVAEGARVAHHLALAQSDRVKAMVAIGSVLPCASDSAPPSSSLQARKLAVRSLFVLPAPTSVPSAAASASTPVSSPSASPAASAVPASDLPPPLVRFWAAANGCQNSPTWVGDPGPQRRLVYDCPRPGSEVIWMPLDRPVRRIPPRLGTAETMRVVTGFLDRSVSK